MFLRRKVGLCAVAFRTKIIYFDRATTGGDVDEDPCADPSAIFLAEGGVLGS